MAAVAILLAPATNNMDRNKTRTAGKSFIFINSDFSSNFPALKPTVATFGHGVRNSP